MNYWEGKKVRLRSLEREDHEFFYNWNLDTSTQKNLAWIWFPTSSTSIKNWIKTEEEKDPMNEEHYFVIETLEGKTVGSITANSINKNDGTFRYGLGIIASERKKGYASEAIKIFVNYYFNELRFNKVNAGVFEFNEGSIKLHERFGMIQEGRLRQNKFTNGKFWDLLLFGMTKDEFNSKYK